MEDVKPRVTAALLTVPGTLSVTVANAMPTPKVSWALSKATVAGAVASNRFLLVSTLKVAATWGVPLVPAVMAPGMNVKTLAPVGMLAPAVVQTTVSALAIPSTVVPVAGVRTQVAVKLEMVVPALVAVFDLVPSTALK